MKAVLIAVAVIVCLLWGAWLFAVPSDLIVKEVEARMVSGEFKGRIEGFRKGWFYDFSTEALDIYKGEDVVLAVYDIRGGLDFNSLLSLRPAMDITGTLAGGKFLTRVQVGREDYSVTFDLSGAQLELTGLYDLSGYRGKGNLRASGAINNGTGEVRFNVSEASFAPVEVMGMAIPVDMVKTVRGIAKLEGNSIHIPSVAFEGKGFHARVSGEIKNEIADLSIELMVSDSAIPDAMLSAILGTYRKSKGHYIVPLKTRIPMGIQAGGRK